MKLKMTISARAVGRALAAAAIAAVVAGPAVSSAGPIAGLATLPAAVSSLNSVGDASSLAAAIVAAAQQAASDNAGKSDAEITAAVTAAINKATAGQNPITLLSAMLLAQSQLSQSGAKLAVLAAFGGTGSFLPGPLGNFFTNVGDGYSYLADNVARAIHVGPYSTSA